MGGKTSRGRVAEINVTPLVDVVLVLLIIFMVTSSYIARRAFEAELPTAASGEPLKEPPIVVEVTAEGAVKVSGEALTLQALAARVKGIDRAVIAADKRVPYGKVTEVIDTLRLSGVARFGLEIRPGAPPVSSE
jgi:biopolymer transport protein ExbD